MSHRTKSPSARISRTKATPPPPPPPSTTTTKQHAKEDRDQRCCGCCFERCFERCYGCPGWRRVCASPISILTQCFSFLLWWLNPVRLFSSFHRVIMLLFHSPEFQLLSLFVFNFRMSQLNEIPKIMRLLPYVLASGYLVGELLIHVSTKWLGAKDP